jgi:hypothetical protein
MSYVNALKSLKNYKLEQSIWNCLSYKKRASVLVVLYLNSHDKLSTILTIRSKQIKSFSGHAPFPGGKADSEQETSYQVARREAFEEIGISQDDEELLKHGYRMEYLTTLPSYLSRNLLAVQPSVVFMHSLNNSTSLPSVSMDSNEVSEVFSCQLQEFLSDEPSTWYSTKSVNWNGLNWNQHWFNVLRQNRIIGQDAYYSVWGLTANILIDCARIAYNSGANDETSPKGAAWR